ncbi:MAG: thiamine pyrophosphate-binding protein, partial [Deltaproteobacteria bacterium]|nr:thiamine pyrophosphate-binding protein [Deltaproteobacteria bacterium]
MSRPAINVVVENLIEAGIDHVFGIPGGAALLLYDALYQHKDEIRSVLARQEGAAACMADMYGRLTGRPGVVIAQGAWMASNAAFGILEAYMAGSPMLIIADASDYNGLSQHGPWQNGAGEYGAFDLVGIMRSMSKYTTYATNADELVHGIRLGIKHATTGRPGPACVIGRMNAFSGQVDPETSNPRLYPIHGHINISPPCMCEADAEKIADLLIRAERPVMIAGRGIHSAGAHAELQELAELVGMPVATSYMGKSAITETHELALGTMGGIGQRVANHKITDADVILAVGTCLAPENTKILSPDFINPERQKIIQIDIESLNAGWTFPVTLGVTSEARRGLTMVIEAIKRKSPTIDASGRVANLKKLKDELGFFHCDEFTSDESPIAPERIVHEVNQVVDKDTIICLDAGNNRQWFAKHFQTTTAGQLFAPGGVGGVGWGVPAALGAQIVLPGKKVIGICGDGGMMM